VILHCAPTSPPSQGGIVESIRDVSDTERQRVCDRDTPLTKRRDVNVNN